MKSDSIRRCLPATLGVIALGASMVLPATAHGAARTAPGAAVAGVSRIPFGVASDTYDGYAQLAAHESEGSDYRRVQRFPARARVAHIAIHGGGIEAPTTQLASHSASSRGFAYYSFEGIKKSGNGDLHITSGRFDEPRALKLVARVDYTVSWHGASGARPTTYVGGRDVALIRRVTAELRAAGFTVAKFVPAEIAGRSPSNIANKNRRGKGVQLEISSGQRERFFAGGRLNRSWIENPANRTGAFYRYTAAVNRALAGL
ncbi:poly-gamma-glutamate hydrolase family protein [Streptosporangium oxazolinicum]|uniref:Poly-gamma-glutamate hydrolase family protein n=1 Tax=Streptosporangium oxazolinicum TaxID=909287 RepID=A0ABP8BIN0_9ACTN